MWLEGWTLDWHQQHGGKQAGARSACTHLAGPRHACGMHGIGCPRETATAHLDGAEREGKPWALATLVHPLLEVHLKVLEDLRKGQHGCQSMKLPEREHWEFSTSRRCRFPPHAMPHARTHQVQTGLAALLGVLNIQQPVRRQQIQLVHAGRLSCAVPDLMPHSLDDMIAIAQHEQQGHLSQCGRRHAFLLHL